MPTKRKDEEPAADEPRKDAAGRELFDWEVDPGDQVSKATPNADGELEGVAGEPTAQEPQG